MSSHRQTGTTTQQMKNAPPFAFYVWPNNQFSYPRDLAKHIGRTDLTIVSAESVSLRTVVGKDRAMIIDHASRWTEGIAEAREYIRRRTI
jgi:hypothetical protein